MRVLSLALLLSETFAVSIPAIRHGNNRRAFVDPNQEVIRPFRSKTAICIGTIMPKIFIISLFLNEEMTWYNRPDINILANNITVPGFSPLFPDAHCTESGEVCQMTTGPGQINAAVSITALWMSGCFNLTSSYFLIAGIGGVNPHLATTGSVTFARYAIQFDLQHEFSYNQVPTNWSSGYVPQGSTLPATYPGEYPGKIYGTEAFELNDDLKKRAVFLAKQATLNDTADAQTYRQKFGFLPAQDTPTVVECDSGTSNVFWSGSVLGDAFDKYTKLLTNGSGVYCNSQQEDNAVLESLLRGDLADKLDFSRIVLMRTASDFDRAPPGVSETYHLLYANQGGFIPALENIYRAGIEIVKEVLGRWDETYAAGMKPSNYVGDVFNSLGRPLPPDIGFASLYSN